MTPQIRTRLQQVINAPIARAVLVSAALHAAVFALWVAHSPYEGRGQLADRSAGAYNAVRAQSRFEVDFRRDHEGRDHPDAGRSTESSPHIAQLVAETASTHRIPVQVSKDGASPGERSGRGGGNDCWVNGFRFCSSGG